MSDSGWLGAERRYDVLDALHAHARIGLAAQGIGALIVGVTCFPAASLFACASWTFGWLLACLLRWHALRGYRADRPPGSAEDQRALAAWDRANLMGGALWGLAAVLFLPSADASLQSTVTLLVAALCLVLPAGRHPVFLVTGLLGFVPLVAVALARGAAGVPLALVLALVYFSAVWVAHVYRSAFDHVFALKSDAEGLAQQLAVEKARVEEVTAGRTRFYTAASHDLRQPLQSLLILCESLQRQTALPPQAASLATRLLQSVRALESLFDALLDVGQLEAGVLQPKLGPVRLEPLFRRIGLHFRTTAFDRGLSLDFRGGEHWVQADPMLLERVLRNLVANAVECTEDGGVLVSCRVRRGGHCLLQVWDTGPGIAAENLPRLFDEFYRGPTPSSARGLGLGLTIAQGFARLMGSGIHVRSTPGHGSVFSLSLPRAVAPAPAPPSAASALLTLAGERVGVVAAHLPTAAQVADQLRLWHAEVAMLAPGGPWPATPPAVLVVGALSLEEQAALLARWQQAWPQQPPAVLLIAAAEHPAAPWPRLVRLAQPLAAHRLRAALRALQSAR